jgi:flagellar hook protein FlgE
MSLVSTLSVSVSGMAAQATMLSTISDNIANANTTGYKDASVQFQDLVNETTTSNYNVALNRAFPTRTARFLPK